MFKGHIEEQANDKSSAEMVTGKAWEYGSDAVRNYIESVMVKGFILSFISRAVCWTEVSNYSAVLYMPVVILQLVLTIGAWKTPVRIFL